MRKINQQGSHVVVALLAVVVIGVVGFVGYTVMNKSDKTTSSIASDKKAEDKATVWPTDDSVQWDNAGGDGWAAIYGTPPVCPDPIRFTSPADFSKATSILYPGQERTGTFEGKGGTYKPHGGVRFDSSENDDITVVSPMDGIVFRGVRVIVEGEVQYSFDIINACGIMVRLGHLRTLTPTFQALAETLPEAKVGDSRDEKFSSKPKVKAGDIMATSVGFKNTKNVGFDWGVYDLRSENEASKDVAYQTMHADNKELAWHALCWLDMLSAKDSATVKELPAGDTTNGKTSDYCK